MSSKPLKFRVSQGVPHSAAADDQRFGPFGCGKSFGNSDMSRRGTCEDRSTDHFLEWHSFSTSEKKSLDFGGCSQCRQKIVCTIPCILSQEAFACCKLASVFHWIQNNSSDLEEWRLRNCPGPDVFLYPFRKPRYTYTQVYHTYEKPHRCRLSIVFCRLL